jgi:hypothetical protein
MDGASLHNVPQSISTAPKDTNGKAACEYDCNHSENLTTLLKCFHIGMILYVYTAYVQEIDSY